MKNGLYRLVAYEESENRGEGMKALTAEAIADALFEGKAIRGLTIKPKYMLVRLEDYEEALHVERVARRKLRKAERKRNDGELKRREYVK